MLIITTFRVIIIVELKQNASICSYFSWTVQIKLNGCVAIEFFIPIFNSHDLTSLVSLWSTIHFKDCKILNQNTKTHLILPSISLTAQKTALNGSFVHDFCFLLGVTPYLGHACHIHFVLLSLRFLLRMGWLISPSSTNTIILLRNATKKKTPPFVTIKKLP